MSGKIAARVSSAKARAKSFVVGLTWKKLEEDESPTKNEEENDPKKHTLSRSRSFRKPLAENTSTLTRSLSFRVQNVKDAFGTLKQKIRSTTRRRERLDEVSSPYRAKGQNNGASTVTPGSAQRRSARLAAQTDNMYSPFSIDTPSKTPSKIRMGIHEPKRIAFNSPGQHQHDVNSVIESLQALNALSEKLTNTKPKGSGIRTTPSRTPNRTPRQTQSHTPNRTPRQRKAIFV